MDSEASALTWSAQFTVSPPKRTSRLVGDKILLPQNALEQLLAAAPIVSTNPRSTPSYRSNFDPYNPYSYDAERQAREQLADRQQQLPHPLTFRLVNPQNGHVVHAGIREFSAEEGEIGLSPFLRQALGLEEREGTPDGKDVAMTDGTAQATADGLFTITVHAKQLPKGTFVKLRPLEAGYDPEDWKALLERHMRDNFTTLTNGEILTVPGGRNESFRFLIDGFAPEGDGICIIDTDLEVDIEPLNEEQARETLKRQVAKSQKAPGTKEGSSTGGVVNVEEEIHGQVLEGDYVDYELKQWRRNEAIQVELDVANDAEVNLLVSPYSQRQRSHPREDEHVFGDLSSRPSKRIRLSPTNVEMEGAEAVYLSVHGYKSSTSDSERRPPSEYSLRIFCTDPTKAAEDAPMAEDVPPNPDDVRCKNCHQWVPSGRMFLHENFCLRNNILCPQCQNVFQRRSPEWENHWHCPHDEYHGDSATSKAKHDSVFHSQQSCPNCDYLAYNLPDLARHRTSTCRGKLILCQFCHLLVPQQGEGDPDPSDPEVILSGLTPHELADGARTTECHLCNKIVRLRDMKTHLRHHDLERLSRAKPRICRNANCGRTLDGIGKNGEVRQKHTNDNELLLCSVCFGPLYVAMYDPEGKALRRRVERRYLTQLLTGCGKPWCKNEYCKTGRQNTSSSAAATTMTAKDALPVIKPLLESCTDPTAPIYFCTDEASQKRRSLAELVAVEAEAEAGQGNGNGGKEKRKEVVNGNVNGSSQPGYELEWCVAALEAAAGDLGKAREWLRNWAPSRAESSR